MLPHPSDAVDKAEIASLLDKFHMKQHVFTAILDLVPAGISIAPDASCREIWHNPVAVDFLRIEAWSSLSNSPPEPHALKIFHGGRELSPEELPIRIAAWQGKELKDYELEFVWEDGVRKTALYSASPLIDEQGTIIGAVATFREIAAQKRIEAERNTANAHFEHELAEQALHDSETKLRLLIDTIPSVITYVDSEQRYRFVNKAYETLNGQSKDNATGRYVWEVIGTEAYQKEQARIEAALSGESLHYESEFQNREGEKRYFYTVMAPEIDDRGVVKGYVGLSNDMTEFRAIERQISETMEFNQRILESSPSGIATFDSSGQCIFANDAAANILGKTKEQLLRQNFYFLEPWKRSGLLELAKQVLATGISGQSQVRDQSAFDKETWFDYRLSRFTAGREPHLLLLFDNITERKQMEKEMARLDRLHLIGEMAVGIGHEIRNPMTVVRGYLQLLQIKEEFQAYRKYFDTMINELDQANAIITEYLSLAKNKGVELRKQSLNGILEAMLPPIRAEAIKNMHAVTLELGDIPDLLLDDKEIRQIVLNLARNGLEAMPAKGALTIKTYLDGPGVVLAVQNHGPEIPPEILEKIGTPFFTTKDSGTGLGMAVCYSIAARHNASIRVETGAHGTTFFVCFKVE